MSGLDHEPDWFSGTVPGMDPPHIEYGEHDPMQEDNGLKPFMLDISEYGLNYAYQKYEIQLPPEELEKFKRSRTKRPRKVIIIGAGMSGLVAGYELAQVGHKVTMIEMQHRVGGRVKTISNEKFFSGLWSDAGAMRIPGPPKEENKENWPKSYTQKEATTTADLQQPASKYRTHYMTDFYSQKFMLPEKEFIISCDQTFYAFYGRDTIKRQEWNRDPGKYCSMYWPGWRETIERTHAEVKLNKKIQDINVYWAETVHPILQQLRQLLNDECKSQRNSWKPWIEKWAVFSVIELLRSTYEEVLLKLKRENTFKEEDTRELESLKYLLPWPIDAIVGFKTLNYTLNLDGSLVDWLRSQLGQWTVNPMHTFKDGLQMLPNAFVKKNTQTNWPNSKPVYLASDIRFGAQVRKIKYTTRGVIVTCYDYATGKLIEHNDDFSADAVIVTLPMNIVRQITFDPPLPMNYYKAFENISYGSATKIMLQCKKQFWLKHSINGGSSKTNLPIGQINYPTVDSITTEAVNERGVLMLYTFKQEALLFGSQSPDNAIAEAVDEVSKIHPEINDHFEVGAVQAWYNDPTAQGAFCFPKPEQYLAQEILYHPHDNTIFFCGEALSTANGWIQGALVSGLRSAYQFYAVNEKEPEQESSDSCCFKLMS